MNRLTHLLLAVGLLIVGMTTLAVSQVPGPTLTIGSTPVTNGTNTNCLNITSGKLGQQSCSGTAADIKVGTTTITSGTTGRVLYDNAGTLGEMTTSGSGTVVALATSPTLTTPVLGGNTWAVLSATTPTTGTQVYCTDCGAGGAMYRYSGTKWKPVGNTYFAQTIDAVGSNIPNSDTVVMQATFPAGSWQVGDLVYLRGAFTKSGTTDTLALRIRVGTACSIADTAVLTVAGAMAAGNQQAAWQVPFRLVDATHVQIEPLSPVNFGTGVTATAWPASVAVTSVTANATCVSWTIASSSTNDTVRIVDGYVQYWGTAN